MGISQETVLQILKKQKYKSFKFQMYQELSPNDYEERIRFRENLFHKITTDTDFLKTILFIDEATFIKNGEPNCQNCRYWSTEKIHLYNVMRTQYPEKVNVWPGIINNRIMGQFFIDGNLNTEKYCQLLLTGIISAINDQ